VQQLFAQLERAGVDRSRITIFSGDGDDPDPDVALLDEQVPPDFWLVDGTRIESAVRPPIQYANTSVDDVPLRPATKAALAAWFASEGRALAAGDVLLFYVTDHGTKNADDLTNNKITLWGSGENLSVQELAALLDELDPGVRVVTVMSQCYSGSFAGLSAGGGNDRPAGSVRSSSPTARAYGCYPENRERDGVGHSFHFQRSRAPVSSPKNAASAGRGRRRTCRSARPTSSRGVLRRAAGPRRGARAVVDAPETAWRHAATGARARGSVVGAAFGIFSPRSLQELDEQSQRIDAMADQLKTHGGAWQHARESLARANLDRFVKAHAEWTERLDEKAPTRPTSTELATALLPAMKDAVAADPIVEERFTALRDQSDRAKAIGYRMEVRQGVVLRMRAFLLGIAGRVYLQEHGSPLERDTYAGLRVCEDLAIPPAPPPAGSELARRWFPFRRRRQLAARSCRPGWGSVPARRKGIRKVRARRRRRWRDDSVDDSPAKAAGLRESDVILGPPGAHFEENEQVREWVMRSPPGVASSLDVLRDGKPELVTPVPQAMPQKWPSLPGPPKVGSAAPPVRLGHYRGDVPDAEDDIAPPLLLATWWDLQARGPELLAFERDRDVQVVAITDEPATELDPFFVEWKEGFPAVVASDETRASFRSYGVSGTPSFVLIDGQGIVQYVATGYSKKKGLAIDGWHWKSTDDTGTGG
jgi:hypothetical protein